MTQAQITLVKRSWVVFRKIDPQLVGGVFYEKLFLENPALKKLFLIPIEDQAQKLVDMLSMLIMHLDDQDFFSEEVLALGKRHEQYGVKPAHYKMVGDALLWTLKQGLGIEWNEALEDAWQTCYQELTNQMTTKIS